MEIHTNGELAEPFFEAIKEAPFSAKLKELLIDEVLTTAALRFGEAGFLGFFDGRDIAATGTGDFVIRAKPSRAGELMIAALRALCSPSEDESRHWLIPSSCASVETRGPAS